MLQHHISAVTQNSQTTPYEFFGADANTNTNIREQENSDIQYIGRYYPYKISAECGCQVLVTKMCNAGRISYI